MIALLFRMQDEGSPAMSTEIAFIVTVTDELDPPPTYAQNVYFANVIEQDFIPTAVSYFILLYL